MHATEEEDDATVKQDGDKGASKPTKWKTLVNSNNPTHLQLIFILTPLSDDASGLGYERHGPASSCSRLFFRRFQCSNFILFYFVNFCYSSCISADKPNIFPFWTTWILYSS